MTTVVRYLLVGGCAFAVDLAAFTILTLALETPAWSAQIASRTIGAAAGFAGHRAFTFRARGPIAAQGLGYAAVAGWNLLWSPWLVEALVQASDGRVVAAKCAAEVLIVVQTWLLLQLVFRAPEGSR